MTVSTTQVRVQYPGAGSTGPFAIPFAFQLAADLRVIRRASNGTQTLLALNTNYTVTGAGGSSGSLTLLDALAVGQTLDIRRAPPLTQSSSFRNQGAYFPANVEDTLDRLTQELQLVRSLVDQSARLPESYDPAPFTLGLYPEEGAVVGWVSATELGNIRPAAFPLTITGTYHSGDLLVSTSSTTFARTKSLLNLDAVSIGGSSSLAPLHVGGYNQNNSFDAQILISRQVAGVNNTNNAHGFSDSTEISRDSGVLHGIGYNSYDAFPTFVGVVPNFNHYAAFQARPQFAFTGSIDDVYGYIPTISVSAGATIDRYYGAYLADPTGTGVVRDNYGIYIPVLTKGTVKNYGIASFAPVWFDSGVGVGGIPSPDDIGLWVHPPLLTQQQSFGMLMEPTFGTGVTNRATGIDVHPSTQAAAFTLGLAEGIRIRNWTKGAGSTITKLVALQIDAPTVGATNYAIQSLGGRVALTLPTSASGLAAGDLWNDTGTVKVA